LTKKSPKRRPKNDLRAYARRPSLRLPGGTKKGMRIKAKRGTKRRTSLVGTGLLCVKLYEGATNWKGPREKGVLLKWLIQQKQTVLGNFVRSVK